MWQIGETQNDLKLVKLEKTKQILYNSVAQMRDAIGLKIDLLEDSPIDTGLIGIIGTVETCNSMSVSTNKETHQLQLKWGNRKCKY